MRWIILVVPVVNMVFYRGGWKVGFCHSHLGSGINMNNFSWILHWADALTRFKWPVRRENVFLYNQRNTGIVGLGMQIPGSSPLDHYFTNLIIFGAVATGNLCNWNFIWLPFGVQRVKTCWTLCKKWTSGRKQLSGIRIFGIQKIKVLFHNPWKWTFEQQQMLCLEWLRFTPRSMAAFSLHEVIINFKFAVYCHKGL